MKNKNSILLNNIYLLFIFLEIKLLALKKSILI